MGYKNLNKEIAPCVIPMAKGAIIVPRKPYPRTVRPVARHQGKLYYRERVSEKGLALT